MARDELPPESEMPRVYSEWLEYLSRAEGKSPATLKAYGAAFRRVLRHAEIHPSLFEPSLLDHATLVQAAYSMLSHGKSVSTVDQTLSAVENFCEFCEYKGVIEKLPNFKMIRRRTVPRRRSEEPAEPDYYRPDELRALLATAAGPVKNYRVRWPERDIAMCRCLAILGLRAGELVLANLDWIRLAGHFDTQEAPFWTLHVQGRGTKRRQLSLDRELYFLFDQWLEARSDQFGSPSLDDPLFVTNKGKPFSDGQLRYWLTVLNAEAGLPRRTLSALSRTAKLKDDGCP